MRKAQESLEIGANPAFEAAHRNIVANIEIIDRIDQHFRKNQQRSAMQMSDQENEKILVAELRQHAAFAVQKETVIGITDHGQRIAGTDKPGIRPTRGIRPVTVLTIALLEFGDPRHIDR